MAAPSVEGSVPAHNTLVLFLNPLFDETLEIKCENINKTHDDGILLHCEEQKHGNMMN